MENFKKLMGGNLDSSELWDKLEKLYNSFITNEDKNEIIPRKIHQIWLGEIPEKIKHLTDKVKEKFKGWEYKLWTFSDLEDYPMQNKSIFSSLNNLGAKSDIARYEILYNEGGIYLDCDFEIVATFDELLCVDFFTGCGHITKPEVFNGLIGCTEKNNLMGQILKSLSTKNISDDIMSSTGPYFFSSVFFNYLTSNTTEKLLVLPTPYFYPFPASQRQKVRNYSNDLKDYLYSFNTDKTLCIHLWFNSWQ